MKTAPSWFWWHRQRRKVNKIRLLQIRSTCIEWSWDKLFWNLTDGKITNCHLMCWHIDNWIKWIRTGQDFSFIKRQNNKKPHFDYRGSLARMDKIVGTRLFSPYLPRKHPPLRLLASGSSALIAMTFQSISPSSIIARIPSTFTWITWPGEHTYRTRQQNAKWAKRFNDEGRVINRKNKNLLI